MKKTNGWSKSILVGALCAWLAACGDPVAPTGVPYDVEAEVDDRGFRAATPTTQSRNASVMSSEFMENDEDFQLAMRGLLAQRDALDIRGEDGQVIWRTQDYAFLEGPAPATSNPSLWRQSRLNAIHGLFEVAEGVYQVRGYDLSNMSIIDGPEGRIIIDPLTAVETAEAAMQLVNETLSERPIAAIILTHSHIDHFGGLAGVVDLDAIARGEVSLIAPAHFLAEAVSENVVAGVVMGRRSGYMYGMPLPRSPRGHVGSGLGQHPAIGTHTIAAPSHVIYQSGQTLEFGGVRMEFQYAPHTEAPAELTVFFPDYQAWCGAEIVSRTLHNLYTLRGAQVRDALAWSGAIDDALTRFGDRTDVVFNSHHWPVWGNAEVRDYLEGQRDIYKYIHDQTLRLAASGLRPDEIAEQIELPEALESRFAIRGYYGTLRHNSRAVYQRYFGWYDGVPAHLNPLPRVEAAQRYVAAMGGLDAVLEAVQTAFADGEYRWSSELAQHAVFAHPSSEAAREWLARSYEQLGYQAESGPWRDVYLTGAYELRHGVEARDVTRTAGNILESIPLDMFFTAMATRLNAVDAGEFEVVLNFLFEDSGQTFVIEVSNGVMRHYERPAREGADATVNLTRDFWLRLIQQEAGLMDMITSSDFRVSGDRAALLRFFSLLEQPEPAFEIVTP